jgi:hypothetical protein
MYAVGALESTELLRSSSAGTKESTLRKEAQSTWLQVRSVRSVSCASGDHGTEPGAGSSAAARSSSVYLLAGLCAGQGGR